MELEQHHPSTSHLLTGVHGQFETLPEHDKAYSTRNVCMAAIAVSYILAIVCFASSAHLYVQDADSETDQTYNDRTWSMRVGASRPLQVILDLLLNVAVTLCTESLGYVHTASLRWALWREGRLVYSSNLRLLSQSSNSVVNSWYINALSSITLILAYAAASQTLLSVETSEDHDSGWERVPGLIQINGVAILFLGIGLFVQAFIASLCLFKQADRIRTWSSNILTITLACLNDKSNFHRREGRCMLSTLDSAKHVSGPVRPQTTQPSLRATDPSARHITRFVWALFPITLIWGTAVAVIVKQYPRGNSGPRRVGLTDSNTSSHVYGLLFVSAFQTFATLGLHVVELLVNRSRDEILWRRAGNFRRNSSKVNYNKMPGAPKSYSSTFAAFGNWRSLTLFALKPIIHWLFGSSLAIASGTDISWAWGVMDPSYTFGLSATVFLLAVFATILARARSKGPMPATWGHLQTVADCIDDWGRGRVEKLYWGDKGQLDDNVRHAGTSNEPTTLADVRMDSLYY